MICCLRISVVQFGKWGLFTFLSESSSPSQAVSRWAGSSSLSESASGSIPADTDPSDDDDGFIANIEHSIFTTWTGGHFQVHLTILIVIQQLTGDLSLLEFLTHFHPDEIIIINPLITMTMRLLIILSSWKDCLKH